MIGQIEKLILVVKPGVIPELMWSIKVKVFTTY